MNNRMSVTGGHGRSRKSVSRSLPGVYGRVIKDAQRRLGKREGVTVSLPANPRLIPTNGREYGYTDLPSVAATGRTTVPGAKRHGTFSARAG
jgi:hypothetical protein